MNRYSIRFKCKTYLIITIERYNGPRVTEGNVILDHENDQYADVRKLYTHMGLINNSILNNV